MEMTKSQIIAEIEQCKKRIEELDLGIFANVDKCSVMCCDIHFYRYDFQKVKERVL